jgi:hypothetical protein
MKVIKKLIWGVWLILAIPVIILIMIVALVLNLVEWLVK